MSSRKSERSSKLFLALASAAMLGFALFGAALLDAAPEAKYTKRLNLNDKLILKAQACQLQFVSQTPTRIIVRCEGANAPSAAPTNPQSKFTMLLSPADRIVVKVNACELQVLSTSTARVVIKCIPATTTPTPTPTATATTANDATATATPTATTTQIPVNTNTPTPTATAGSDWLAHVNTYRSAADLPAVGENTTWSNGDWLHSRYMVKNDYIGHSEDSNNQWYTTEGSTAAQNSNVAVSSSTSFSDNAAIDLWIQGPFHAVGILDPALNTVGYGSYHEAIGTWQSGAALDVLRGLGSIPPSVTFPIEFPGSGKTIALTSYSGGESPDPLSSCAGYTTPTGLPIILQIGSGSLTPNVTAHSFKQGVTNLEHCIFDETNYTNSNSSYQSLGRSVLGSRDAIVLIPRAPLVAGNTYTVSITTNGNTYTWSFTVSSGAAKPISKALPFPQIQIR